MIDSLKPYPEYKDSGSPWLGAVPTHWEVRNLRTLIKSRSERNRPDLPLLSVAREKGVFVRSLTDDNHNFIPDDLSNYKVAREGNLIINKMKAWQGSMGIAPCDGLVSPAYYVFDLRIQNHDFGQRMLRSKPYVAHFARASDGVRIGQWDLSIPGMREIPIIIPNEDEQATIVRFLDNANRRINHLIRNKQQLIKLLIEQKQVITHRAVTRGLSPAVRLKPSGIEWLSDIPEKWQPVRLRALAASLQTGPFGSQLHAGDYVPNGIPVINPSHMVNGKINADPNCAIVLSKAEELSRHRLLPGDIVFARRGELGRCVLVGEQEAGWLCGTGSLRMRLKNQEVDSEFLMMLLLSKGVASWLSLQSVGSTMENLNTSILSRLPLPLPPKDEQKAIVKHVFNHQSKIDLAIDRARSEIDLIREYRTRLIADVVTGKLDVRGVGLPELKKDDALEKLAVNENSETDEAEEDVMEGADT